MIWLPAALLMAGSVGGELHSLHVVLDPPRSTMACTDTIGVVTDGTPWEFRLDPRLRILQVLPGLQAQSDVEVILEEDADPCRYVLVPAAPAVSDTMQFVVSYGGAIPAEATAGAFSHQYNLEMTAAVICTEGVFLGEECFWFPRGHDAIHAFRVAVQVPAGWESVSQGERTERLPTPDAVTTVWEGHYPTHGLTLVAGPYRVAERRWNDVAVCAFFYESELDLVSVYLDAAVARLKLYDGLLGEYPYAKFAIVQNFLPTGYAMPSFTLLGGSVLRLPFIPQVSLGHEVLHNWWGNGVYVADEGGNWCEGLTTYLADYWYEEMKGDWAARDYRRQILLDYANYVGRDDETPLTAFTWRTTPATRALGYGKAAMLFHMLRTVVGQDVFFAALRTFYRDYLWTEASWSDLQRVFSQTSGQNLDWFFSQWVERPGAPILVVDEITQDSDLVHVRLRQGAEPYRLLVPLTVRTNGEDVHEQVWLSGAESSYTVTARSEPTEVVVDAGFDLFRLLHPEEVPPALGRALADSGSVFVVLEEDARDVAESLARLGQEVLSHEQPPPAGLPSSSVVVGMPTDEWVQYFLPLCPRGMALDRDGFTVGDFAGSWAEEALVAALSSPPGTGGALAVALGPAPVLRAVQQRVQHYGKYGYLVVSGGVVVAKGQWEAENSPLRSRLEPIERSTSRHEN